MTHYAWTIRVHGWHDLQKVTTLAELHDILEILELPGVAPADWVTMDAWSNEIKGHGRYTHDEGGKDEWSISWTTVDDAPIDGMASLERKQGRRPF
jgi:hypothetical protein